MEARVGRQHSRKLLSDFRKLISPRSGRDQDVIAKS
jgi:hypothetical protein